MNASAVNHCVAGAPATMCDCVSIVLLGALRVVSFKKLLRAVDTFPMKPLRTPSLALDGLNSVEVVVGCPPVVSVTGVNPVKPLPTMDGTDAICEKRIPPSSPPGAPGEAFPAVMKSVASSLA